MADIDFLSEQGARELARRITAYWAAHGCNVDVRVEKIEQPPRHHAAVWGIQSDLGLYFPPRSRAAAGPTGRN
jgi:hypothetical protein